MATYIYRNKKEIIITAEGVSIQKDGDGGLAYITVDLIRHKEALFALTALGLVQQSPFEIDFEKALTIYEAEQITLERIRNHVRNKD